jgi:hypothetical protein
MSGNGCVDAHVGFRSLWFVYSFLFLRTTINTSTLTTLTEALRGVLKGGVDLERLVARVHVGSCKLTVFLDLLDALDKVRVWLGVSCLMMMIVMMK